MSDRRKAQRFSLPSPEQAQLYVAHDVVIERREPDQLTVLSTFTSPKGEQLTLRLRGPDGEIATVNVCTVDSRPIVDEGGVRYQLELRVCEAGAVAQEC